VEAEKGPLAKQKEARMSHLFHARSRRRWGLGGLVLAPVMFSFGLAAGSEGLTRDNGAITLCSRPSACSKG